MFDGQHLETYLHKFIADYKRVRGRQTKSRMKYISTTGLLAGMIRVDEMMQMDLTNKTQAFLQRFEAASVDEVLEHLLELEQIMARDQKAIEFLCKALDVARNAKSFEELKEEVDEDLVAVNIILHQVTRNFEFIYFTHIQNEIAKIELAKKRQFMREGRSMKLAGDTGNSSDNEVAMKAELKSKLSAMMTKIEQHLQQIHKKVKRSAKETIQYVENHIASNHGTDSFEGGSDETNLETSFNTQVNKVLCILNYNFKYINCISDVPYVKAPQWRFPPAR